MRFLDYDSRIVLSMCGYTVKPKFIQTSSTFLTLSQCIRYSLENGNKI